MSLSADFAGNTTLALGSVRGYRCWRPAKDGLGLKASVMSRAECWMTEVSVAECLALGACRCERCTAARGNSHPAPQESCLCGIYAWYQPQDVYAAMHHNGYIGVIEAFGKTVLCPRGFRAERARVLAVSPIFRVYETVEFEGHPIELRRWEHPSESSGWAFTESVTMLERAGIPVFDTYEHLLAEYPPENISHLLESA